MGYNITNEACDGCGAVCEYDCETGTIFCPHCGGHAMRDPWLSGRGIPQPGLGQDIDSDTE